MKLDVSIHRKEGIYIYFSDGNFLDLSRKNIQKLADEYWDNPAKLPPKIREHDYFKTCSVCPFRGQNVFCSALKPLLPFLEAIEKFKSITPVKVLYVNNDGVVSIVDTVMKNALQYVTNMSLLEYCEDAKLYNRYFRGTDPLMNFQEAVYRIFLNIYWLNSANKVGIKKIIDELRYVITVTSQSCVKRLNLMCQSDAFINAYIRTHTYTEMLSTNLERELKKYFA